MTSTVTEPRFMLRISLPCKKCKRQLISGAFVEVVKAQIICASCWRKL